MNQIVKVKPVLILGLILVLAVSIFCFYKRNNQTVSLANVQKNDEQVNESASKEVFEIKKDLENANKQLEVFKKENGSCQASLKYYRNIEPKLYFSEKLGLAFVYQKHPKEGMDKNIYGDIITIDEKKNIIKIYPSKAPDFNHSIRVLNMENKGDIPIDKYILKTYSNNSSKCKLVESERSVYEENIKSYYFQEDFLGDCGQGEYIECSFLYDGNYRDQLICVNIGQDSFFDQNYMDAFLGSIQFIK